MFSVFVLAMFATTVAEEGKAPEAKPTKEAKVCRSEVDTGSRLGKRQVCRTASEWRALDDAAGDAMESRRRSGN